MKPQYKEVKYYEEWLAGQHGGHTCKQVDNWLYCDTCKLKFRTGVSSVAANKILTKIKAETRATTTGPKG